MTVATITEGTSGSGTLFTGVLDTRIREVAPTINYSASVALEVAAYSNADHTRSLIAFPGLSNITGPVTVASASLFVFCSDATNALNQIGLHRVKVANTMSQVTWNEKATGSAWASAGAYNATDVDTTAVSTCAAITIGTWVEFTGAGLAALVEGWINGTIPNYGVMMRRTTDANDLTTNEFASSESGTTAQRPYLVVTYTAGGGGGGLPVVTAANATCNAADGAMELVVLMDKTAATDVTGVINTADGTAVGGVNFALKASIPFRIPAGQLSTAVSCWVSNTQPAFYLNLSDAVGADILGSQGAGYLQNSVPGAISAQVLPSVTSGVAPLYVNFDMTGTTSTLSTNPTHECFFATDFGDPGSGAWANGVQSAGLTNKNTGYGPVTGHVYEVPGTYHPTIVVVDGAGNVSTRTGTIVVQDPNVVYSGANTICISHSGNFAGAPAGSQQINTAGNTDMAVAVNTYKASNKRVLLCKADAWTASVPVSMTNISGLTLGGYGAGVAATFGSGTMVSVTPAALANSLFRTTTGVSDLRICNFKIASNATTGALSLNNSIDGVLVYKMEVRGCSAGFDAYPGGGGTNNVFDRHCMYECLVDNLDSASGAGGISAFVGLNRGGVIGCYFDSCNYGEQTLRIPFVDRGHINNNYIARPNKTKNILKIHGFAYNEVALYSEKFVVSGNVFDVRGGYAYNGTTVTEVGECQIVIGNGGISDNERVRNGIVENNYTYGCRANPKRLSFVSIGCPNMTVRNNIADFLLGTTAAEFVGTFSDRGATFCYVGTSTPDPTVGVRIYNNTMYCNIDNSTGPMVWITGAATTGVVVQNNLSYQPYLAYWADKIVYAADGATGASYTASNNTVNQTTNPNFTATPPVTLADWKPATGSYAINAGATVPVLRDFDMVSRVGSTYDIGAKQP